MTVKDLKKQLKGKYTTIFPYNAECKCSAPFSFLGSLGLDGLRGRAFDKALDEKEVVSWELGKPQKVACWSGNEMKTGVGHYQTEIILRVYIK